MSPYWSKPLRLLVLWPVSWGLLWVGAIILMRSSFGWSRWGVTIGALVMCPICMIAGQIIADVVSGFVGWLLRVSDPDAN